MWILALSLILFADVTIDTSWCLDAFGLSSTFPDLLSQAGFSNYFVQRNHFAIKRFLAKQQQTEFHWQPRWDKGEF